MDPLRIILRRRRDSLGELGRLAAMLLVLAPAARVLPEPAARSLARGIGTICSLTLTSRTRRRTLQRLFGLSAWDAFRLLKQIQAAPFTDFVFARRAIQDSENPNSWTVIEINDSGITALRESGRSFILATGHFLREAFIVLYTPRCVPHRVTSIVGTLQPPGWDFGHLRMREQFGEALRAIHVIRPDAKLLTRGEAGSGIRELVAHLSSPGHTLIQSVDAHWDHQSGIRHPFASESARPLACGAASISRLSQCPIIPCIPVLEGPRRVRLEWGDIIEPAARTDKASDARVTAQLLKFLEPAVGLRPEQYMLPFHDQRVWDEAATQWGDPSHS